ncbi:MAG: OmpA family protein [candidate division Zixibacteria bacterium]|nr:OmpA family protein [candidate division Zixibacteria bacterium]
MRNILLSIIVLALLVAGCGVNKGYVQEQITQSESRTNAQIATLTDQTDTNAGEITKLRSLATELSGKTNMAINKAKGFENYQILWSGEVNYDFDSWKVTEAAEQILFEAGEKMEVYPGSVIEITGHTDRTGSAKYNIMLGEKRANAVKRFLAERFGTSLYRMFVISYGRDKPVAMSDERQAASKNRRVTLKIWGMQ